MDADRVCLKLFSFRTNGGRKDDVTGDIFEPSVVLKFCNQSVSKFFTVRITDMSYMPMIVFVSGHGYNRSDPNYAGCYNPETAVEMFRNTVNENCDRMCREIELAFPNLKCDIGYTGLLVQSDSRSLKDTLYNYRLHRYTYGTLVTLRLAFNCTSYIMDMDTYKNVYEFIQYNGTRGVYQVHDTLSKSKYLLESIHLEQISKNIDRGSIIIDEYQHNERDYAYGYRTHSIDLRTVSAVIDRFEYDDIADNDVLEYDYESWLESSPLRFTHVNRPQPSRSSLSSVYVEFTIVLNNDGSVSDIQLKYDAPFIKENIISYANSKIISSESTMLLYFINDTHHGYNRPTIIHRRVYCSKFNVNNKNVTKRKFIQKLLTRADALGIRNVFDGKIDTFTCDMFSFSAGSVVEYVDLNGILDTRVAIRNSDLYDIPLSVVSKIIYSDWYKHVMDCIKFGIFIPSMNVKKIVESSSTKSSSSSSSSTESFNESYIVSRSDIDTCIKYNLTPNNVFIINADELVTSKWYPWVNKIAYIYDYDPGVCEKYNIKGHKYNRNPPVANKRRVVLVGRRRDSFSKFMESQTEIDMFFDKFSDFSNIVRLMSVEYSNGYRLNDKFLIFDKTINKHTLQQYNNVKHVNHCRILKTGDAIVNHTHLLLLRGADDPDYELKNLIFKLYPEFKPNTVCCVRAVLKTRPELLIRPREITVSIEQCFGRHFNSDITDVAAKMFKTHRASLDDTIDVISVINSLTDEQQLTDPLDGQRHNIDYAYRCRTGNFSTFLRDLFNDRREINNNDLIKNICEFCKNFKCNKIN